MASTERTQDKVRIIKNGREEDREYLGSHYVVVQMVDTDQVYSEQRELKERVEEDNTSDV